MHTHTHAHLCWSGCLFTFCSCPPPHSALLTGAYDTPMRGAPPLSLFSRGTCRPRQPAYSLTVNKCWSCWPRQISWALPPSGVLRCQILLTPHLSSSRASRMLLHHRGVGTLSSVAAPGGYCGTPGTGVGGVGLSQGASGAQDQHAAYPASCGP